MIEKTIESSIYLNQNQAEVLQGLSNFLTIKNIAKWRKVSRTAIYNTINILLKKSLIKRIGVSSYELTELGKGGLHSFMGFTQRLRQHNLSFKIEILESPKNWEQKREKIVQLPYFNKRINLKNTSYDLLNYGKLQVKLTSKSVIIKIPTIYAKTVDEAVIQSMGILQDSIIKLENAFKIRLINDYKANVSIISQEYANINDSLAKLYKKEGNKLYITDEENKVWLIADYSFSVSELETISPIKADEDMRTVSNFLNDLRKNPATMTNVLELIRDVTANQFIFDKNMSSHIEAIQNLSKGVKKLTKVMGGILKENRDLKLKSKHQKTIFDFSKSKKI